MIRYWPRKNYGIMASHVGATYMSYAMRAAVERGADRFDVPVDDVVQQLQWHVPKCM